MKTMPQSNDPQNATSPFVPEGENNSREESELPSWKLPAGLISHRDADDAEGPCTD